MSEKVVGESDISKKIDDLKASDEEFAYIEKLQKILQTPSEKHGPRARAILSALKVYNMQIDSDPP